MHNLNPKAYVYIILIISIIIHVITWFYSKIGVVAKQTEVEVCCAWLSAGSPTDL